MQTSKTTRAAGLLTVALNTAATGAFAQGLVPLQSFYSPQRQDAFAASTAVGVASGYADGYYFQRTEGCVFDRPVRGGVPLNLWYNTYLRDNFLAATPLGNQSAQQGGYTFIRQEGYALPFQAQGTVPLYTFWNPYAGDNLATTDAADAQARGYQYIRIEAYVYPAYNCVR